MSKKNIGTCKICGESFEKSVNYGCEYGIIRLDCSDYIFGEADLCPACLRKFFRDEDVFTLENKT